MKAELQENGMSQAKLAKLIGVSAPAISHWACGRHAPMQKDLEKMAEVLNCSVDELNGVVNMNVEKDLLRNGSGYVDMTAHDAIKSVVTEDVEYKQGEIWEYRMNNGEVKYAIIVSADECENGKFRSIIILNEEQKGSINVPIICRGMKYADCAMVSFGVCHRFENFVRQANEDEWKEVHEGIAQAFGFEIGGSPLADRWKERYEKAKEKLYETEQMLAEERNSVVNLTKDIDITYRENAKLAEKVKYLESQPVFAPDPDEVIRLKAQVEMLERQNEKLLDRLIG